MCPSVVGHRGHTISWYGLWGHRVVTFLTNLCFIIFVLFFFSVKKDTTSKAGNKSKAESFSLVKSTRREWCISRNWVLHRSSSCAKSKFSSKKMENRKIIPPTQQSSSSSSLTYHFKSANSSPNSSVDRLQVSLVIWKLVHITMFEKKFKNVSFSLAFEVTEVIWMKLASAASEVNEVNFQKKILVRLFCSFHTLCMDFTSAWNCFLKWQHAKQNFVQAPLKLTQPFCIIFWLQKYVS